MGWISISTIGILLIISYQDFSERLIHWFYFPLVALLLILQLLHIEGAVTPIVIVGINLMIVFFMLTLTTIIYGIRHRELIYIVDKVIGLADILALGLVCLAFSPINPYLVLV